MSEKIKHKCKTVLLLATLCQKCLFSESKCRFVPVFVESVLCRGGISSDLTLSHHNLWTQLLMFGGLVAQLIEHAPHVSFPGFLTVYCSQ